MILPYYLFSLVLLCPFMGWLGFTAHPKVAAALVIPFMLYLAWVDLQTGGVPMLVDPYGWIFVLLVLGPYAISWLAYFVGKFGKSMKMQPEQL